MNNFTKYLSSCYRKHLDFEFNPMQNKKSRTKCSKEFLNPDILVKKILTNLSETCQRQVRQFNYFSCSRGPHSSPRFTFKKTSIFRYTYIIQEMGSRASLTAHVAAKSCLYMYASFLSLSWYIWCRCAYARLDLLRHIY